MAYNEPVQGKLVGYAQPGDVNNQSSYNTQAGVTIKPDAYYDMMLLKMLRQMEFHYSKYAIQKSLPKNYGDTINWRRFKKLEVAQNRGLLTEGVTPEGKEGISGESITAVIQQYGEVMYFTDLVDIMQLDDVRREYTIELGYIAQETLDLIVRDVLVAEGSVFFAGGNADLAALASKAQSAEAADKLSVIPKIDEFRRILLGFKKDYVTGVRGAAGRYVALISPEVMFALFDDERMLQYMNFGQTNAPLQDGVAIDMFGIRFEEVLNAPVVIKDGEAMHDSIILADEAYAITKLAGEGNVRVITKGLGSAGVSDPLDQRQSIGYKITGFGAKVLRPESVVNYWSVPNAASGLQIDLSKATRQEASRSTVLTGSARPTQDLVQVSFQAIDAGTGAPGLPIDKTVVILKGETLADAIAGLASAPTKFYATDTLNYKINNTVVPTTQVLNADTVVSVESVPNYVAISFTAAVYNTGTNTVAGVPTGSFNIRNGKTLADAIALIAPAMTNANFFFLQNGVSGTSDPTSAILTDQVFTQADEVFVGSIADSN